MIDTDCYRFNKDQTIRTDAGEFLVEQRNAGFADNDGAWIVSLLPEIYWTLWEMRRRRPGHFVGAFATPALAEDAIRATVLPAIADTWV